MNSEKVISNIKKAIKEHLDNNYAYDMLVDFELDVIDWNSLFEYIDKLQQENKRLKIQVSSREEVANKYKEVIDKAIKCIDYSTKYRNSADIYQFVDIESEILEPLKFILELDEENGNAYLKEFNDWLKRGGINE